LLAQALIAETASAFFELPLLGPQRALVVAPATMPNPVALRQALDGLAAAPWVHLRTASDTLTTMEPLADASDLGARASRKPGYLTAARAARRDLATFARVTVGDLPEIPKLDRLVLMAESSEWDRAPNTGTAVARSVSARVRAVFRGIGVAQRSVTLTSRSGEVPVTVFNQNPFPVRVRVWLVSAKVLFPAGAIRTREIPPPSGSIGVPVQARAAGSFPLVVRIETPDGARLLARGELTLRSTAISAVALSIVGGSTALLLFAWARRSTRRRKPAKTG
jgi:hypothetical protein